MTAIVSVIAGAAASSTAAASSHHHQRQEKGEVKRKTQADNIIVPHHQAEAPHPLAPAVQQRPVQE